MFTLYIVATPIGNMEDITLRALRVLREVGLVAAEDTRTTKNLLQHFDIKTPLTSYHERNKQSKLQYLLQALQEKDVALVSDAGTPGMSDPGFELISAAVQQGIKVVPIPGVAAPVTAVMVSGLPLNQTTFLGFFPRQKAERRKMLESLAAENRTLVVFEAPHRLRVALRDIIDVMGNRRIAVCREMTKLYEEIFRGTAEQALQYFTEPRGEFTLVIEGNVGVTKLEPDKVVAELRRLRSQGIPAREATQQLAEIAGLPRKELYRMWLQL
jgi:16S rRNA (cytidine1402-2'-O)-methyltransferase